MKVCREEGAYHGAHTGGAVNLISRETLAAWPDASPSPPLRGRGHDTVVLSAATYHLVQGLFACQTLETHR
jgi:hypothetical protein